MDLSLYEFRSRYGINGIRQMESVNENRVSAYQVVFEAKGFDLTCVDVRQGSAVKGVAEENLEFYEQGNQRGQRKLSLTTAATLEAIAAGSCSTPRWTTWAP